MPHLQITEAIRRYGVSDASTTLIVIRVDVSNTLDIQRRMCDIVKGSMVPFEALEQITDWSTIKKVCHDRIICFQTAHLSLSPSALQVGRGASPE